MRVPFCTPLNFLKFKDTSMKKFKAVNLYLVICLACITIAHFKASAQNVGIGIASPLDKLHVNGGTIRVSTLASGVVRAVLADGTGRLIVATGSNSPDWTITGNSATNPATNYIGTTDAIDFVTRTSAVERMRVFSNGKIAIGQSTMVSASDLVDVVGSVSAPYALAGYSAFPGAGVYGYGSGGGYGVYGNSTLYGVFGRGGTVGVYGWDSTSAGFAVLGNQRRSGAHGISGIGGGINITYIPSVSVGVTASGDTIGLFAKAKSTAATNGAGTGIVGVGNGLGFYTTLGRGSGIAGTGQTIGVAGFATSGLTGTVGSPSAGGYFEVALGATNGNAYVAAYNGTTQFKILGSGGVSSLVKDMNEKDVIMFCPESPEVLFQDYGTGMLKNGFAHIDIDPIFSKNIFISDHTPLRVFIQLEGNCNGVYVTNKSKTGFDVYELNNGVSNTPFVYTIVGNRADSPTSKYAEIRFPEGPHFKDAQQHQSSEVRVPQVIEKTIEQQ